MFIKSTRICILLLANLVFINHSGWAQNTYKLVPLGIQDAAQPYLSQDGRYLVYGTFPTLSRLDLETGAVEESIPLHWHSNFSVSADGNHVALERSGVSRYTFSTNSVVDLESDNSVESITISGNGNRIAFRSSADRGSNPDESDEWFILDIPTNTITQITDSQPAPINLSDIPGAFNYDGTRFAFNSDFGIPGPFLGLWEEGIGTRNLDQTGAGYSRVTMNAAGDFICFTSGDNITGQNPDNFGEIFGYDIATETFTQMTNATTFPFALSDNIGLSNDGQFIYFVSNGNYSGEHAQTLLWAFDRQGNAVPVSDAIGYEVHTDYHGGRTLFWRQIDGESQLFLALGGGPSVPTLTDAALLVLIALIACAGLYMRRTN